MEMEIVVNLLMAVVAAALIGFPFLGKGRRREYLLESMDDQVDTREVVFSALGEIEFDYQMKKLSDEDYQELKEGYQSKALAVLEAEDQSLEEEAERMLNQRSGKGARLRYSQPDEVEEDD
jgi:hypothetical protein